MRAAAMIGRVREALGIEELVDRVDGLRTRVNRVLELEASRPPAPAPFVCALVEAAGKDRLPRSLGGTCEVTDQGRIELVAWEPLWNVRVLVFADLRRVNVTQMLMGVSVITAGAGTCPVGYYDHWDVGVRLTITCLARR